MLSLSYLTVGGSEEVKPYTLGLVVAPCVCAVILEGITITVMGWEGGWEDGEGKGLARPDDLPTGEGMLDLVGRGDLSAVRACGRGLYAVHGGSSEPPLGVAR